MSDAAPSPAQLRRWTEAVAEDPRSPAFLPLARAYAARGYRDAALRLCLQGLAHHPEHVDAHFLLGTLYHEAGDEERAFDEWDIAVRLDPGHAAARRALGLLVATVPAVATPPAGEGAVQALRGPVERLAGAVAPASLLLMAASGRLLGQYGFDEGFDTAGIASLAAGVHAATVALAGLLQQERFGHILQRGRTSSLFIGAFATGSDDHILVVVLRDESRLGLLRIAFDRFVDEVRGLRAASLPKRPLAAETFERDLEAGRAEVAGTAGASGSRGTLR